MAIDAIVDTSIIIDFLRQYSPARDWFVRVGSLRLAITPIVWMETVAGTQNRVELNRALKLLNTFQIEHLTVSDNDWSMLQFSRYRLSHGVENQDVMLAAVTARLQVTLYTRSVKHYTALPDVDEIVPY